MDQLDKKKLVLIIAIVLVGVSLSLWQSRPSKVVQATRPVQLAAAGQGRRNNLLIYVSGAVYSPGIYEVEVGSRVKDALALAGGCREEANLDKVNLVRKCKEGMQINVPYLKKASQRRTKRSSNITKGQQDDGIAQARQVQGENAAAAKTAKMPQSVSANSTRVNINTASQAELEALPGIGPSLARKIIEYRSRHSFGSIEDIMQVPGVGSKKFKAMSAQLEV